MLGVDADGGACGVEGPKSIWDEPRRMMPWTMVVDVDGGPPISTASGCAETRADRYEVTCHRAGTVRTGTKLELVFEDVWRLAWDPTGMPKALAPPHLVDGEHVEVDYTVMQTNLWYNGSYGSTQMQIRDGAGELIFAAIEGEMLDEVDPSLVDELFGVSARREPTCGFRFGAGCYDATRTVFDNLLETQPKQRLVHGQLTRVVTPKGSYDVIWADSDETAAHVENCADGPLVAHDRGFMASLVARPGEGR